MRIHYLPWIISSVLFSFLHSGAFAQYKFKVEVQHQATSVKNQDNTGTCWSFATASFLESELMRMGQGKHDLSEMFVVRNVYKEKAKNYLENKGETNFSQGSLSHDLITAIENYGIVPESVYTGKREGERSYNHNELEHSLRNLLTTLVTKNALSQQWMSLYSTILDTYMGKAPEQFTYKGETYTPKSFTKSIGLNMNDYISITSFSHHQFYETFILDLPDNFAKGYYYNVPLDEFEATLDNALKNGYTVSWDADVTEKGFSAYEGIAILPLEENAKHLFKRPCEEMSVDQTLRQAQFESQKTTDDHLMHITGIARDQDGNKYYIAKNSWGKKSGQNGYMYISAAYFRLKSISLTMHKDALPMPVADKLAFTAQGMR